MSFCSCCGEYTTKRHAFGHPICDPCYDAEDDAVDSAARSAAARHGYRYGWSDDEQPRQPPTARESSER